VIFIVNLRLAQRCLDFPCGGMENPGRMSVPFVCCSFKHERDSRDSTPDSAILSICEHETTEEKKICVDKSYLT